MKCCTKTMDALGVRSGVEDGPAVISQFFGVNNPFPSGSRDPVLFIWRSLWHEAHIDLLPRYCVTSTL